MPLNRRTFLTALVGGAATLLLPKGFTQEGPGKLLVPEEKVLEGLAPQPLLELTGFSSSVKLGYKHPQGFYRVSHMVSFLAQRSSNIDVLKTVSGSMDEEGLRHCQAQLLRAYEKDPVVRESWDAYWENQYGRSRGYHRYEHTKAPHKIVKVLTTRYSGATMMADVLTTVYAVVAPEPETGDLVLIENALERERSTMDFYKTRGDLTESYQNSGPIHKIARNLDVVTGQRVFLDGHPTPLFHFPEYVKVPEGEVYTPEIPAYLSEEWDERPFYSHHYGEIMNGVEAQYRVFGNSFGLTRTPFPPYDPTPSSAKEMILSLPLITDWSSERTIESTRYAPPGNLPIEMPRHAKYGPKTRLA